MDGTVAQIPVASVRRSVTGDTIGEVNMANRQVTMWELPGLLLELVPEAATPIAQAAVQAWKPVPGQLNFRHSGPLGSDALRFDSVEDSQPGRLEGEIGSRLYSDFAPHGLFGGIFLTVFHDALDADPIDEDLARRCCQFIERALSGESTVATAADVMVIENLGSRYASRVLPFAGPAFRAELLSSGFL
jgi:hypothetical protein